jgi:hypothetical protein
MNNSSNKITQNKLLAFLNQDASLSQASKKPQATHQTIVTEKKNISVFLGGVTIVAINKKNFLILNEPELHSS